MRRKMGKGWNKTATVICQPQMKWAVDRVYVLGKLVISLSFERDNWTRNLDLLSYYCTKVSFFVKCIKKQLITLQNFLIQTCFRYRKVASSSMSRLVAHFQIFRGLMKGKFDAYVLWPLTKKFQTWIVDQSWIQTGTFLKHFYLPIPNLCST